MASLVFPDDLAEWAGQAVPAPSGVRLLERVSGAIRAFCGWSISEETATVTFSGYGRGSLFLPTLHLTDVASVVEDGVTLVPTTDYDWTSTGLLIRRRWSYTPRGVVVTFTHGYQPGAPLLSLAESVCLSVATRLLADPSGLRRSWTLGDESETYAVSDARGGTLLSQVDRSELAPLVLPVVA